MNEEKLNIEEYAKQLQFHDLIETQNGKALTLKSIPTRGGKSVWLQSLIFKERMNIENDGYPLFTVNFA